MLVKKFDATAKWFFLIVASAALLLGLIFKPMYRFDDSPYFEFLTLYDIAAMLVVGIMLFLINKYSARIEQLLNYYVIAIVFFAAGLLYILLIPLIPFSDMANVWQGAQMIGRGDIAGIRSSEYLQVVVKNLKVSVFYGIFLIFLPKSIITAKIVNIVAYILIAYFTCAIGRNYGSRIPKTIFALTLSFLPFFLFINHIYYDLPVLFFFVVALYHYTKLKSNIMIASVFLSIALCLRLLAAIFIIAVFVDYIIKICCGERKAMLAKTAKGLVALAIIISVTAGYDAVITALFRNKSVAAASIWTNFYIGVNEEEYGFMNNEDLTKARTFQEVIARIQSRSMFRNMKLLAKKVVWTWTQGTYQAQRYGFGVDACNAADKYGNETMLGNYVLRDDQVFRKLVNAVSRAEYIFLFLLMLSFMYSMKNISEYRVFNLILFGTMVILFIYEMKSRYILSCMPIMILYAANKMQMGMGGRSPAN